GFLMAAGSEQVLDFLEQLQVSPAELEWLESTGRFSRSCLDYLETLRFSGDVHAMQEGTVFFPNEPILRVTPPPSAARRNQDYESAQLSDAHRLESSAIGLDRRRETAH